MSTHTRHFVLIPEQGIREFSAEQAALIAGGASALPELAGQNLRYLQLTLNDEVVEGELKVQTAGASIRFDKRRAAWPAPTRRAKPSRSRVSNMTPSSSGP